MCRFDKKEQNPALTAGYLGNTCGYGNRFREKRVDFTVRTREVRGIGYAGSNGEVFAGMGGMLFWTPFLRFSSSVARMFVRTSIFII